MSKQAASLEVQNLDAFKEALKGLNERMKARAIIQIIRKVAGPVEKAAKTEAAMIESKAWSEHGRINTGNLEASIGRIKGKSKEFPNIQVAPRVRGRSKYESKMGRSKRDSYGGYHAAFIQFGTRARTNKKGHARGATPANPFMQRAFDKTFNNTRTDFENQVAKYIEKMANKGARTQNALRKTAIKNI